jgi:hypothetical protein
VDGVWITCLKYVNFHQSFESFPQCRNSMYLQLWQIACGRYEGQINLNLKKKKWFNKRRTRSRVKSHMDNEKHWTYFLLNNWVGILTSFTHPKNHLSIISLLIFKLIIEACFASGYTCLINILAVNEPCVVWLITYFSETCLLEFVIKFVGTVIILNIQ